MTTPPKVASPDLVGEPRVFSQSEYDHDTLLAQMGGWKVHEEGKSHWSEAWKEYYDIKTANIQTSWAKYEKSKDEVERKWQDAKTRRGSTSSLSSTSPPRTPSTLSVETDIASAARRWSNPDRARTRARSPEPSHPLAKSQTPHAPTPLRRATMPSIFVPPQPSRPLSRMKSSPVSMRAPASPWSSSPLSSDTSPKSPPSSARSEPRPIPTSSASAYTRSPSTPFSRSAPVSSSPPTTGFWSPESPSSKVDDTFETFKRERELRALQAEYERRREQVIRETERRKEDERRKREAEAQRLMEEDLQRKAAEAAAAAAYASERAARHRLAEEASRKKTEERQRRDMERGRHEDTLRHRNVVSWERFEQRWKDVCSSSEELTFTSIPWPMESKPSSALDINVESIKKFILSPLHSSNKQPKQRLREQLLRYHPDRFESRFLRRVPESDRALVKEAVNTVAQCLNAALAQQN